MTMLMILVQWTLRSSILILSGALLLSALRVKDPSVRLAAWIAVLLGSLAIPAMTTMLPAIPITLHRHFGGAGEIVASHSELATPSSTQSQLETEAPKPGMAESATFDWPRAALISYALVGLALLLRLCIGLIMTMQLLRRSRPAAGIGIYESERVSAPVTLGIIRPAIVLPVDWRDWEAARLEAVLAHERSHIRRHDPAVQLLSAIHRALLWHSPLSWFLHSRIVRIAEEASDDAAVATTRDRATYAEWLLEFMQRGVCNSGVPMARYGSIDKRIHRILNATVLSRGITRLGAITVLALGAPLAYVVATAQIRSASESQQAPAPPTATPQRTTQSATQPKPDRTTGAIFGLGNVTAMTVTVRPRIDGQLMSVSFKEGESVHAGQVLASMDTRQDEAQLQEPMTQGVNDQKAAVTNSDVDLIRKADASSIKAPISGIVGLRMVDPGNIVHTTDAIVTIAQMQPIAVVFTIPEESLPRVRARLATYAHPVVEAWSRDNRSRLASGVLTGTDNQIDQETGTIKLKASFDNKDGALFPNQFVNVRLLLNSQ